MSALAGIVHFDGGAITPGLIEAMTQAMAHRAPDGIAHWRGAGVALGHGLMRTTPESLGEAQPLHDAHSDCALVFDGWLEEPDALRAQLETRGAQLRGRSESELVLAAYGVWGEECLERLDGDFALALWDGRRRALFCARDRLGVKPFHWARIGDAFVFASELRPVLDAMQALGARVETDEATLAEYLSCDWRTLDTTLWQGARRLPAAHAMRVTAESETTRRYWSPVDVAELPFRRQEEWDEHYRALFFGCVRRAARSHRPIACDVSGGLDSSAVFAAAVKLQRDGALRAPGMTGYTLAFEDGSPADEIAYARAVAAHVGAPVVELAPFFAPLDWFAARARQERDFPGNPNAALFLTARARAAADGARVALGGEGGDHYAAGSTLWYAEALAAGRLDLLARGFRAEAHDLGLVRAARFALPDMLLPFLPARLEAGLRDLEARLRLWKRGERDWLAAPMRARLPAAPPPPPGCAGCAGRRLLAQTLDHAYSALVAENAERIAARAGIELRHPFMSRAYVEAAFATPEWLRLQQGLQKALHLRALAALLPPVVLARRDKAEFSGAFRRILDPLVDRLSRDLPAARPDWLDPTGFRSLAEKFRHEADRGDLPQRLWTVLACHVTLTQASDVGAT